MCMLCCTNVIQYNEGILLYKVLKVFVWSIFERKPEHQSWVQI